VAAARTATAEEPTIPSALAANRHHDVFRHIAAMGFGTWAQRIGPPRRDGSGEARRARLSWRAVIATSAGADRASPTSSNPR